MRVSIFISNLTMEKDDLVQTKQPSPQPTKLQFICDTVWLSITSVVLLVVFITSGLANDTRFGFQNTTGAVSDIFFTQVSTN